MSVQVIIIIAMSIKNGPTEYSDLLTVYRYQCNGSSNE